MEERVKLPRIHIDPRQYTTGDAQDWTYEWTWEDYYAIWNYNPADLDHEELGRTIAEYFLEHPEKLIEEGPLKDYTFKDFMKMCRNALLATNVMFRIDEIKRTYGMD